MTLRAVLVAAVITLSLGASACGNEPEAVVVPKPVPDGLVPATAQGNKLGFYETQVENARKSFAEAGPDSLAADGRLWELRTGDRLVGVLQLTTLMPDVDLQEVDHRDALVRQMLPAARDRIDVGDVAVWTATASGRSTYLWFGEGMFALFTVKPGSDDAIEPEAVLQDVLDHMVAAESWKYVYFDDEDEEEEEV